MEIVVVLCRAETSLNIGAVCRVMANCDLKTLRIVGDKNIYNEEEVLTLALHAKNIWECASFFPGTTQGLKNAIQDCNVVFATTRREGTKRKQKGLSPKSFAKLISRENYPKIAIVFGNERTGLTDEEVALCSHSINIPASIEYPSYNLSHAVLIIAYTIFTSEKDKDAANCTLKNKSFTKEPLPEAPLLRWKDRDAQEMITFASSCEIAEKIVFQLKEMRLYKKGGEEDCQIFLSNLLLRAKITKEEAEFFANIFNKLFYVSKKNE